MKNREAHRKRIGLKIFCFFLIAGMAGSITGYCADKADQGETVVNGETAASGLKGDAVEYDKEEVTFHISLDAGHGGEDSGAGGNGVCEKNLALKLARYLKKELEQYENVQVDLTRKKDVFVPLEERTKIALEQDADLMISLHFDSYDPACAYSSGCSAIVARKGSYRGVMAKEEMKLARSVLHELEDLGIEDHGLIRRASADGETYPDGSIADYYGVIKRGILNALPTILIEHGFVDSSHDYLNFFNSDAKLRDLAKADARGIARYLRLAKKKSGKILKPFVRKGKKQVCHMKEDSYVSLREKSFRINQIRKGKAVILEADENDMKGTETGDVKAVSQAASSESEKKAESQDAIREAPAGLVEVSPRIRQEAVRLLLILLVLLALWYIYAIKRDRRKVMEW